MVVLISVFLLTLLAHLLYDFHWQGDFVAQGKGKYKFILGVHALTWSLLIAAILYFFGVFAVWKLIFLFVTHYIIDGWKSHLPKNDGYFWALYVDQGLHFLTLVIVVYF